MLNPVYDYVHAGLSFRPSSPYALIVLNITIIQIITLQEQKENTFFRSHYMHFYHISISGDLSLRSLHAWGHFFATDAGGLAANWSMSLQQTPLMAVIYIANISKYRGLNTIIACSELGLLWGN